MKIIHIFRAPVGGLFRHVRDLARGQLALGHEVGIICDSRSGGEAASRLLESASAHCSLGIHRIDISRLPGLGDARAVAAVRATARRLGADVLHGHGAKGGLYARPAARLLGIPSVYTPHGGSLHYDWSSPAGAVFLGAEWALARIGSGVAFVCRHEQEAFERKIGRATGQSVVVYNGLWPEEFSPATPSHEASDFVFIGELRDLKGVDVLLEALALVSQRRAVTACLVGDGPDEARYRQLAQDRGLSKLVQFPGRLPTDAALAQGRTLVLPSRAESFPYVVLEAAARAKPVIASAVGGIPEILPTSCLVPAGDAVKLAGRLAENLDAPSRDQTTANSLIGNLRSGFDAQTMSESITRFYASLA